MESAQGWKKKLFLSLFPSRGSNFHDNYRSLEAIRPLNKYNFWLSKYESLRNLNILNTFQIRALYFLLSEALPWVV